MDCSTSGPRADLPCDQEAIRLSTCFECDNGQRCGSTELAANKDQTSSVLVVAGVGRGGGGGARSAAGVEDRELGGWLSLSNKLLVNKKSLSFW